MMNKKGIILLCFLFAGVFSNNSRADDTEIFGGGTTNVPPNVIIIFDNSGSMDEEVTISPPPYDKTKTYSGPYSKNWVYRSTFGWSWNQFQQVDSDGTVQSTQIGCENARTLLNSFGYTEVLSIGGSWPHNCPGSKNYMLRTGNYLNYLYSEGATSRKKIDIAKEVICDLIDVTDGVRFGIMVFNQDQGGHVVAPCKTRTTQAEKDALKTIINAQSPWTWTPLAETLAEAGLYFAGKQSWANPGSTVSEIITSGTYISPIQWRCQKNYVIIMTDGESTQDRGSILTNTYLNGLAIGDYDQDVGTTTNCKHTDEYRWIDSSCVQHSYDSYGSDYLDDVAKFLYDQDLRDGTTNDLAGISFNDPSDSRYQKQNVITYTIGFSVNHKLLSETADTGHGQGQYYTTAENINLSDAFQKIIASILQANVEFVAPVVPVNRTNKTYADNGVYLGIFSPDSEGFWAGNIKKFGFSDAGQVLDRHGYAATDSTGTFLAGAHSCWGTEVVGTEGMAVEKGGAGAVLLTDTTRTFYTRKTGTGLIEFNKTNITPTELGFPVDTDTSERDDLVDFVRAEGDYSPSSTGTKARTWVLGDILHSRPGVLYDKANSTNVIFVGANDGFLHCFLDNDHTQPGEYNSNLANDTVEEAWSFIPYDLVSKLGSLPPGDNVHDYFVDGSPIVFSLRGTPKRSYVAFGLRRGGDKHYCLNVSYYNSPSFAWEIPNNILGTEILGQSWCTPRFCTIKAHSTDTTGTQVLLYTGGYDTNQDNADPGTQDSKGRAVFAIEPGITGCTLSSQINFNGNNYPAMNYSIIDLNSFDHNNDGFEDTIYAGTLGGDLFVFYDRDGNGTWQARKIFHASSDGGTTGLRKFFYSPGVVQMTLSYEYLYIGSGDREDPLNKTTTNRLYAIKNKWPSSWDDDNPITVSDLVDLNIDYFNGGTQAQQAAALAQLDAGKGWWFNLPNSGEKMVSSPVIFDNAVWFTTFTPSSTTVSGTDVCSSSTGAGTARIYAVNYLTGTAMFDLDNDGQKERSTEIGSGIPSDPVVIVTKSNSFMGVGIQEGVLATSTRSTRQIYQYYWIQK